MSPKGWVSARGKGLAASFALLGTVILVLTICSALFMGRKSGCSDLEAFLVKRHEKSVKLYLHFKKK